MTHEIMVAAKTYIGTKIVKAEPITRGFYNTIRGWTVPAGENPNDDGYIVEYLDGGAPNHPDFHGYVSWSPKEQFEAAYNCVHESMTFGHALVALEAGERVCRAGWNGKGMFVALIDAKTHPATPKTIAWLGNDEPLVNPPHFVLYNAAGEWQQGWVPSQGDLLAKDWMVVKSEVAKPTTPFVTWDAELHEVGNYSQIVGLPMSGTIRNDSKRRFLDGTYVHTSIVAEWDAENNIATTKSGTRYKVTFTEAQNKHG